MRIRLKSQDGACSGVCGAESASHRKSERLRCAAAWCATTRSASAASSSVT